MPSILMNYSDWYTSGTIVRKLLETPLRCAPVEHEELIHCFEVIPTHKVESVFIAVI